MVTVKKADLSNVYGIYEWNSECSRKWTTKKFKSQNDMTETDYGDKDRLTIWKALFKGQLTVLCNFL